MISRFAAYAGVGAGLLYGMLYLAYEVTSGWDVPTVVVVALGLLVVVAATAATEVALRAIVAEASKEV